MPDIIPPASLDSPIAFGDPRLPERFWSKVSVNETGCWVWTAKVRHGYGQFSLKVNGRELSPRAHRHSYAVLVGPIPEGLHLDHLCRVRSCVNPAHLEAVTQAENNRRAAAARTHCPAGHPFSEPNIYFSKRGRQCRTCRRDRNRQIRERAAADGAAS